MKAARDQVEMTLENGSADGDLDYLSRSTVNRRQDRKLIDDITSKLYRLELERVKPSFDVLMRAGLHRGLYQRRKRRPASAAVTSSGAPASADSWAAPRRQPEEDLDRRAAPPSKWQQPLQDFGEKGKATTTPRWSDLLDSFSKPSKNDLEDIGPDSGAPKYSTLPRKWKPDVTDSYFTPTPRYTVGSGPRTGSSSSRPTGLDLAGNGYVFDKQPVPTRYSSLGQLASPRHHPQQRTYPAIGATTLDSTDYRIGGPPSSTRQKMIDDELLSYLGPSFADEEATYDDLGPSYSTADNSLESRIEDLLQNPFSRRHDSFLKPW